MQLASLDFSGKRTRVTVRGDTVRPGAEKGGGKGSAEQFQRAGAFDAALIGRAGFHALDKVADVRQGVQVGAGAGGLQRETHLHVGGGQFFAGEPGVAGEGSRASGVWYSRAVGSGIYINVGTTWHVGSKVEAMGVRPARPGAPGDLVALWLRRVFGEHQSTGSACYGLRRTPQYWSKVYRKRANLTQAELLPHLEANHLELRTVMLCPEVRS